MKEVVWVFGTSASGKETFIRQITEDKPVDLINGLGWTGKQVTASSESIDMIDGELGQQRDRVIAAVPQLLESSDVVLIKWQWVDSAANRPQRLKEYLPDVLHRVVELKVGIEELLLRLPKKHWWHDLGKERAHMAKEQGMVAYSIEVLPDFDQTVIDSTTPDYKIIT